ncbi:MAG: hypothetical protein EBR82_37330 [Caulobacteraceae bacterium]|nr:hypothetical protein [Caulobacteraceae bacterium]
MEQHEIMTNRSLALQALKQHNVTFKKVDGAPLDMSTVELEFYRPLDEILWPVVTKFSHIDWVVEGGISRKNTLFSVRSISAYKEGIHIGNISTTYTGRTYAFIVKCHAIDEERTRGNGLRTTKHDVVLSTVKKKFAPKPINVILSEVTTKINRILSDKHYAQKKKQVDVNQELLDAVLERIHESKDVYEYAVRTFGEQLIQRVCELKLKMSKLEDLHSALTTESSSVAVVLIDRGGYIVSSDKQIAKYNDSTLPGELRKNLGLLKLLDKDEKVIPDIGVRVNESVFLVLLETP